MTRESCLEPIANSKSRIIILGTMPGKESLKQGKYYANPNNHFWDYIFRILNPDWNQYDIVDASITYHTRYNLLMNHNIALWDVIASCERKGNSDKNICNLVLNDFESFFKSRNQIDSIIFNGKNPEKYFFSRYKRSSFPNFEFITINSSSSQNKNNTFKILKEWKDCIKGVLDAT